MIRGIKFASVPVRNQDVSLKFYTEKLGFRILTDQALGKGGGLREEIPLPVGAGDVAVGIHEHRVGGHDVHHREREHHIGMVERHAVPRAAAAVVANNVEALKPEAAHKADLIIRKRSERIV